MKININLFAELLLIIISCYLTQTTAKCPSAEVIVPCICQNNAISCGGHEYYNLRNVFISLSSALNDDEKHFNTFSLSNTAINELVSDVFYDITFSGIYINSAYNLTNINTNAFTSTSGSVRNFFLHNTPYGNTITDSNNIFNAINAMINVEYVYFMNTSLTTIPSHAFTALNKLQYLFIEHNRNLKSFEDYAFYHLNNLAELLLDSNPIDHISEHALSFRNSSRAGYLHFYWFNMPNFTSNSFSSGALKAIKRPFILYLYNFAAFKYLDEKIFRDVLETDHQYRNRIYFSGTPLECDCRMYWLYRNEVQVYQYYVENSICTDGKSVFDDRPAYNDCNAQ